MTYNAVAVDLGASSGRMILGAYDGGRLELVDEYRMENGFVDVGGNLYWDVLRLYQSLILGFRYFRNRGHRIHSVGVSTWGVDFVPLGKRGQPAAFPRCYRDLRNNSAFEAVSNLVTPQEFYTETGILPCAINTVYQLWAAIHDDSGPCMDSFLFLPDYFCYLMTGEAVTEMSVASTSQLVGVRDGQFSRSILRRLGLDHLRLPEILQKPQPRGCFTGSFAEQAGFTDVRLMAVNSHDTGAAISLAEALPGDHLLMNSGTYNIISSLQETPFVSDYSFANGITNERLLDGRFRPARNHSGLFFINQCRQWWKLEGKDYSWDDIVSMAAAARSLGFRMDIADPVLCAGGNMPRLICAHCAARGLPVPETDGELARLIYESMAATFADCIESYEKAAGRRFTCLNVVGGGGQNRLLNQFIANAAQIPVVPGAAEATAIGNILCQLEGAGEMSGADKAAFLNNTFAGEPVLPVPEARWDALRTHHG